MKRQPNSVRRAWRACVVVASEAEEKQALRCIELTRLRDGLTVRVELPREQQVIDFDG